MSHIVKFLASSSAINIGKWTSKGRLARHPEPQKGERRELTPRPKDRGCSNHTTARQSRTCCTEARAREAVDLRELGIAGVLWFKGQLYKRQNAPRLSQGFCR